MVLADVLVSGVLMGLVYALLALGLTIIFGVMDTVNFAHGEFLMIGMYAAWLTATYVFPDPLAGLPVAAAVGALLGVAAYALLVRRLLRGPMVAQLFGTFGLMLFLRYGALAVFGPNVRSVTHGVLLGKRVLLGGIVLDATRLAAAAGSAVLFGLVYVLLQRTRVGVALRATAVNREAAQYMGIDTERMNALGWAIGGATAGMAGALLTNFYYVSPTVGTLFAMITFTAVALGGFGSVPGAFVAGILVGVVQMLAAQYVAAELKLAFVYLVYFLAVMIRPQGLLGVR
ncbi:MAG: branched-chain amino acid ABC transporter permease [Limnochordaceae bacterium]|nr:branched-chain amino acid ABC transporter permease [Limnochordaceae bacterium]